MSKFNGHFDNCEFQGNNYDTKTYRLYNHEGKEKLIYLLLKYNPSKKILIIERSIRKWYLGGFSLLDLTKETANRAFSKIAAKIGVSAEYLLKAKFSRCEVGLNIRPRIPIENVIPMIVRYSTLRRYEFAFQTVGFDGSDISLKIYDKGEELLAKNKTYDKFSKSNAFAVLKNKGYHFLRVEFNMYDKQSFVNKDMPHIKTIGDLLNGYIDLYYFWAKEVGRIILLNKLIVNPEMTPKEYLIARTLEMDGFTVFERTMRKLDKKYASIRMLNEARRVIENYSDPVKYNTNKFKEDVLKNLKRIKAKEVDLDIDLLVEKLGIS